MKRRRFIQRLGLATGTLLLPRDAGSASYDNVLERLNTSPKEDRFWEFVQQQFPFPEDYVYLNTGGLGVVPAVVQDRILKTFYKKDYAFSPGHNLDHWNEIKSQCAPLFGPKCTKEEVAFTSTATESINIVVNGLPLKKGDEVITSTHEHPALHVSLLNRMKRDGIVIKAFEPDMKHGLGNVDRIHNLITDKTRLIFISHFTCTTGQRFPEKEIGDLARSKGIWYGLDGAQTMGNMPVDVGEYGADCYALSGHKWLLGPKRTGILYVRREMQDVIRPTTVGAYSDNGYSVTENRLVFQPTAMRYEYGTQNDALFQGLSESVGFIRSIGQDLVWKHNKVVAEYCVAQLEKIPGVELCSPREEEFRTSLIAFRVKGFHYRSISHEMNKRGIRVRPVPENDLEMIRVSFHLYNSKAHVDRLVEALEEVV